MDEYFPWLTKGVWNFRSLPESCHFHGWINIYNNIPKIYSFDDVKSYVKADKSGLLQLFIFWSNPIKKQHVQHNAISDLTFENCWPSQYMGIQMVLFRSTLFFNITSILEYHSVLTKFNSTFHLIKHLRPGHMYNCFGWYFHSHSNSI